MSPLLSAFVQQMHDDLRNEWTHLQFYLYHASAASGLHAAEYKEFLTEAAKGETEHVQNFLDRLFGLGATPVVTGGKEFPLLTDVQDILNYAVQLETEVIDTYATRIKQLDDLPDANASAVAYLKVFYEDQLQDSYEDREKILRLLK
jgi:bacterioferritin (cytochrome b1)